MKKVQLTNLYQSLVQIMLIEIEIEMYGGNHTECRFVLAPTRAFLIVGAKKILLL